MPLTTFTPPVANIEWIYEGTDPALYEYDVGSTLNRAPKQIYQNFSSLALYINSTLLPNLVDLTDRLLNIKVPTYSQGTVYNLGDYAVYENKVYKSLTNNNTYPTSNSTYWVYETSTIQLEYLILDTEQKLAALTLRVAALEALVPQISQVDSLLSRVTSLESLIVRLDELDDIISRMAALENLASNLSQLEILISKMAQLDALILDISGLVSTVNEINTLKIPNIIDRLLELENNPVVPITETYLSRKGLKTENFISEVNSSYLIGSNIEITLPSGPSIQNIVQYVGTDATVNNVKVKSLDSKMFGLDDYLIIDLSEFSCILMYKGYSEGWCLI